jgi:hypothetical protein
MPIIALNVHYRYSRFYQAWLFCATWILPTIGIIEMNECGFFRKEDTCQGRNFFIVFAAAIGNPTLSSLALGQNRAWSTAGFVGFFIVLGGLFFNQSTTDKAFYRNSIYCEYVPPYIVDAADQSSLGLPHLPERNLLCIGTSFQAALYHSTTAHGSIPKDPASTNGGKVRVGHEEAVRLV